MPTSWSSSRSWWIGLEVETWEAAPTFVMTDADGAVIADWHGTAALPLLRGCIQAFSHVDQGAVALESGLAPDEAYAKLSKIVSGRPEAPTRIFSRAMLLARLYEIAMLGEREKQRALEVSAATAAGQTLRDAMATKDCSWLTLQLAFSVMLFLPPAVSISQHEAVAALLRDDHRVVASYAAHTLACMGPQAVAEHFEEIMSLRWRRGECMAAAWLCLSVLSGEHLARLEARGARVSALLTEGSPFAEGDVNEGLLRGSGPTAHAHRFPGVQDVRTALHEALLASRGRDLGAPPSPAAQAPSAPSGAVVQDAASMLSAFVPSPTECWSSASHASCPIAARQRATELLLLGYGLSKRRAMPMEVWVSSIMPRIIRRRSKPGGVGEGGKVEDLNELSI